MGGDTGLTAAPGASERENVGQSVTCPACGSPDTSVAFAAHDRAILVEHAPFQYAKCAACVTLFASPQPDDSTLAAAYSGDYGNYSAKRSLAERIMEPLAQREADMLVRKADRSGSMIELGCGTGRFLERVRLAGWTGPMEGIEYEPTVAAATNARLGAAIEVTSGSVETFTPESGKYSLIVLRHVIEHLRQPIGALERLRVALAPGGLLYLATPDANALSAKVFGPDWVGCDAPRHLVIFNRDSLRAACMQNGLKPVHEQWHFAPQMWNGSFFRAIDRGRNNRWTMLFANPVNPLVTVPACVLNAVELLMKRSMMYSLVLRAD